MRPIQHLSVCLSVLTFMALANPAPAAIIFVGDHLVLSESRSLVEIRIQAEPGDPPVSGINFAAEISGTGNLPSIVSVDLTTDTIFAASNIGTLDQGSDAQHAFFGTAVNVGSPPATIPDDGLLATIELDTSAVTPNSSFELILSSVLGFSTELLDGTGNAAPIPLAITDGRINVVSSIPEPASIALLAAGFSAMTPRRRRDRRH